MEIHFAPLQGYVDNTYREAHRALYDTGETPAVACYYTPFIRMEHGEPRRQDITRLKNAGDDVVPQIIFNSTEEFDTLTGALKALECRRIDLNLGCPFRMQTRKGRGAAMIADKETMAKIVRRMAEDKETVYSVKMRLGLDSPEEWRELIPLLNQVPLAHVTVHPRIAEQMYEGELHEGQFREILEASANPVIWNGDIKTPEDISAIASRYPSLKGIMIGRGLLARPSLAAEWAAGEEWPAQKRLEKLLEFHDRIFREYSATLCGPVQILQKIKPFWDYLEPEIGRKALKGIKKASTLPKYEAAVGSISL